MLRFEDPGSVRRAIDRWNGIQLLPDLQPLAVHHATRRDSNNGPRSFDDANRRERQARGNYTQGLSRRPSVIRYDPNAPYIPGSSHSRRSSGLETMGFPVSGQFHSRRSSSVHTPQAQTGFPQRSGGIPVGSHLNSSLAEVAQHQFALNRFNGIQAPLEHIANHKNARYQSKERGAMDGLLAQSGLDRKENFPLTSPHKTPSRNKSKKKCSRHNTPTQPTPASSPSRSGFGQVEEKLTLEVPKGQKKKNNPKKRSASSKSDAILVGSGNNDSRSSTLFKSEAAPSGFSTRDATSFTAFKSDTLRVQLGNHNAISALLKSGTATPGSISSTSLKSNIATTGSVENEATSPTTTERTEDTGTCVNSTDTSFSTLSSRKPSDATIVSDQEESRQLGPQNDMVGNANTETKMTSKSTITRSHNNKTASGKSNGVKPEIKSQKFNRTSTRKSDSNAAIQAALDSTTKANGIQIESQDDNLLAPKATVPEINIVSQTEWPALHPAKSSLSSIADGKRPPPPTIRPPTIGPSGDRKADKDSNKNKKVRRAVPVIAVPRTFQPRSQS